MREPYGEGVAIHAGPESCLGDCKAVGEALTRIPAGWALSREIIEPVRSADAVETVGRQDRLVVIARLVRTRAVGDPVHARKPFAQELAGPGSSLGKW